MPGGTKLGQGQAARRRVRGDDPRRGRARHRHRARRDHGPRRPHRQRRRPRRRHPARRASCRSRPTSSSSRSRRTGPTAWASTASRARCTPPPAPRCSRRRGPTTPGPQAPSTGAEVRVEAPDLNPRFTARVFEDVTIAPSPPWLKARLMAAGQRPINNVVDITNYVMLEAGQPMHAFDLDRVAGPPAHGPARARRRGDHDARRPGPRASTRRCSSSRTTRARRRSPASWAARAPRSTTGTTRVLMEAANWVGPNIHRTSQVARACAARRAAASRRACRPSRRWRPRRSRRSSWSSSPARRCRPGTIDVGGAGPAPADDPAAHAEGRGHPRHGDRARPAGRDPHRARVRACADGRRRPRRHRPALPPRRRLPRGRPDRGGRADRRPREAPGDAAQAPRRVRRA